MKKLLRRAALTAFAFGCMTCAAFAMDADVTVLDSGAALTPAGGTEITNKETVSDPTSYKLSYRDTSVKAGEQYLVLMVSVSDASSSKLNYTITSDSLIYINQTSSTEGNVTFDTVYPSSVADSVILLTGGSLTEPKLLAKVDAQGILGDGDESRRVNVGDVTKLLRYIANLENLSDSQLSVADVDRSGSVNVGDATKLLRYIANLDTLS